ncbi:MAG: hypothetical protein K6T16_01725, partial [Candidatus Pacearchaeota archaeon]|nr:hypothetical protein [Candidatus Pacearchaeota archaeon]
MAGSGLEALFEGDKPLVVVDSLPFSLGCADEFKYLFGGNLPVFPEIAVVEKKRGWNVKLPSLWVTNFKRFIEWAWNEVYIPNADRVALDIERAEEKLRKKYGDIPQFREEVSKMHLEFLRDCISSSIKSLEGTGYYAFFNQEKGNAQKGVINELFGRVAGCGDQELTNASFAALGAFISDMFNRKMSDLFEAGVTKGKFYWKDRIFRYKVMRPILNKWFQTVAKQVGEEAKDKAKAFADPDLALIESNFDRGKLIDMVHYGAELIDYPSYQMIRSEIINQIRAMQKEGKVNFRDEEALEITV